MTTTQNITARSGKIETLNQVLVRIQRMHIPSRNFLMCEDWDWLVVLQCLQDHNLFKSNPKRPPLTAFVVWLRNRNIPQYYAKCSMREMSLANTGIRNARYPWTDVTWEPSVLRRWRWLYQELDKMLAAIN